MELNVKLNKLNELQFKSIWRWKKCYENVAYCVALSDKTIVVYTKYFCIYWWTLIDFHFFSCFQRIVPSYRALFIEIIVSFILYLSFFARQWYDAAKQPWTDCIFHDIEPYCDTLVLINNASFYRCIHGRVGSSTIQSQWHCWYRVLPLAIRILLAN